MKNVQTKKRGFLATQIRSICAIALAAVFAILLQACLTAEEKKADERVGYLVQNNGDEMFTKPPLEGETILATYSDNYIETNSGQIHEVIAAPYKNYHPYQTPYHNNSTFSVYTAARYLLATAVKKYPDIDIDELDVRSIEPTGTRFTINISSADKRSKLCNFFATTYHDFKGIVVRLNIE